MARGSVSAHLWVLVASNDLMWLVDTAFGIVIPGGFAVVVESFETNPWTSARGRPLPIQLRGTSRG